MSVSQFIPAQKVDKEKDDADDEEYQHGRGEADNLGVILGGQLVLSILLENVGHSSPELHRLEGWLRRVLVLLSAVPTQHVDNLPGEVHPVGQGDGHGHDGEEGQGQGHPPHHYAPSLEGDAAAALLEQRHLA